MNIFRRGRLPEQSAKQCGEITSDYKYVMEKVNEIDSKVELLAKAQGKTFRRNYDKFRVEDRTTGKENDVCESEG